MKYADVFFPCCGRDHRIIAGRSRISDPLSIRLSEALFRSSNDTDPPSLSRAGSIWTDMRIRSTLCPRTVTGRRNCRYSKTRIQGAFAVIGLCVYFVAVLALWSEAELWMLPMAACIYPFSRSLSGISVVSFQAAKNSGLLRTFQDGAQKMRVRIVLIIWACICVGIMLCFGGQQGGSFVIVAAAVIAAALLVFVYYHWMSRKKFGGTTGDLAGYFLQVCELADAGRQSCWQGRSYNREDRRLRKVKKDTILLDYVSELDDEKLSEYPAGCEYSRFTLILAQFRHLHTHMGMIMGFYH